MVSIDELRSLVDDADIEGALDGMLHDGLVMRLGDLLSVSWVAVRASRLQAP